MVREAQPAGDALALFPPTILLHFRCVMMRLVQELSVFWL
ncbi:hypothetical protein, partial [Klebsiella pneumoniae]